MSPGMRNPDGTLVNRTNDPPRIPTAVAMPPARAATVEERTAVASRSTVERADEMLKANPPDYERAMRAYLLALDLNPKEYRAYFGLGNVYFAQKLYDKAADAFERAIKLKPKAVEAHYDLGVVRLRQGDKAAALAQVEALRALRKREADELAEKLQSLSGR